MNKGIKLTSKLFLVSASLLCLVLLSRSLVQGQRYQDFTVRAPLKEGELLIIGFMGGRESWNNDKRGVRKLALKLRAMKLPGVHVETVENKKRRLALELVRKAFDYDRDGQLDVRERASARMIVYGQSFGGAAVVKFARQLKKVEVPVLLTVQVDSVGRGDKVIPSNVARAANLFQRDGLIIKGERKIHPEDPRKTTIIGNYKFAYKGKKIDLSEVSWLKRLFQAAHTKMDHDPEVWGLVERLILDVVSGKRISHASTATSHLSHRRHKVRLRIGSMASFQSDGSLFDGNGVYPDVLVEPVPEFFIGGRDNVLEEAVKQITERQAKTLRRRK